MVLMSLALTAAAKRWLSALISFILNSSVSVLADGIIAIYRVVIVTVIKPLMETDESENDLADAVVFQSIVDPPQLRGQFGLVDGICFRTQGQAPAERRYSLKRGWIV